MTSPKPGKRDTKPGKREREKRSTDPTRTTKTNQEGKWGCPVAKRDGAESAEANIIGRVTADPNRIPLVVGDAGNGAIWPEIVLLKGWFAMNAMNRDTSEKNAKS